jgi:hypothetical protein
MKFTYNGTDERTFPTLALVVKPGDSFEAPDDFSMANVSAAKATPVTPVADPTPTVGESNDTSTTIG